MLNEAKLRQVKPYSTLSQ